MNKKYIERYLEKSKLTGKKEVAEALTHKSADTRHYERLEFLGDAVLGLVISDFLYREFDEVEVGKISRIKSYLVSKEVLYKIGKDNNIIKLMKIGTALRKKELKTNKKIISDIIESLIGAVYLLKGYRKVADFIQELYEKHFSAIKSKKDFGDYKSGLQIKLLSLYNILPEYSVTRTEGKEHKKTFYVDVILKNKIIGKGKGKTIKDAQQQAAKKAVKKIIREAKN